MTKSVFDTTRLILYRVHEKGLEILLVSHDMKNDPDIWQIPDIQMSSLNDKELIELETDTIPTYAIEADWHDIPSIRGIIKHDAKLVKNKIKTVLPGIEKRAYFTIKEAFKKVMPEEYKALKELKDILLDRNLTTSI